MKFRRGRCRCGAVLDFQKGPEGYKTRCSQCGCIVRLQRPSRRKRKQPRPIAYSSLPILDRETLALLDQSETPHTPYHEGPRTGDIHPDTTYPMGELPEIDVEPWDGLEPASGHLFGRLILPIILGSVLLMGLIAGVAWYLLR